MESKHRIGIIDDDPAVRDSMHLLLEEYGFRVSEYASATDYLKNPNTECVLLVDLSLSDVNGMDLIDVLRGGEIETPVILLTDIAEPQLSPRISAAGNCSRLDKPVTAGALLDRIGTSIRQAECASRHR
ncbi:MAG TPA: response regulator [Rhizomicrobium sp.]|nr:response regulator [Rhizomicrobium sp.]